MRMAPAQPRLARGSPLHCDVARMPALPMSSCIELTRTSPLKPVMNPCLIIVHIVFVLMQELHSRIQPMLIFFIDACNFLEDAETGEVDPRWEVYLAVRREGEHHIVVTQLPDAFV